MIRQGRIERNIFIGINVISQKKGLNREIDT